MKVRASIVILTAGILVGVWAWTRASPPPQRDYDRFFPRRLAKDFYPRGLTRARLLARRGKATPKTGVINADETWRGTILITGDLEIRGSTVHIEPGTVVLVAARRDDRQGPAGAGPGGPQPVDPINPHDPPSDEAYVRKRVHVFLDHGGLEARGTVKRPIVITSSARAPQADDWLGLSMTPDSKLILQRSVVEYFRAFNLSSSQAAIRKSIVRNMLEAIVIAGQDAEVLTVQPKLIENVLYNSGHHTVTVLSGSPVIRENVIRVRPDMDFPGCEWGAMAVDPASRPTIESNFLEAGLGMFTCGGNRWEKHALSLAGAGSYRVSENTFANSEVGLETYPGPWSVEGNNFVGNRTNLAFKDELVTYPFYPPDLTTPRSATFQAVNNFWGTTGQRGIRRSISRRGLAVEVAIAPWARRFLKRARPTAGVLDWD